MSALALQQPPLACRPLHSTSAAPHAHASSAAVAARHRGRGRGRAAHAFPQAAAERSLSPGAALDQAEPLSPTFRLGREVRGNKSCALAWAFLPCLCVAIPRMPELDSQPALLRSAQPGANCLAVRRPPCARRSCPLVVLPWL